MGVGNGVRPLNLSLMPNYALIGSKRKIREAQRVEAMQRRLNRLYEMCRLIKSEDELDTYLRHAYDDELRAEIKKLVEPFCLFKYRKVLVTDADPATPEKATAVVLN